jgi:hypothetical protein
MAMLKKVICSIPILLLSSVLFCQTVIVKKDNARINGENLEGLTVDLEGSYSDVNSSFTKYVKSFAKTKQSTDYITLTESTLSGKIYALPIFALTKEKDKAHQAWIGIKASDWSTEDAAAVNANLEKIMYDFGIQFYRDKVQVKIDESTRALQAVEKQQQRFTNQNRDLTVKLEDNKREKTQLEKFIENNSLENELLIKKIEKNKKDQDSLQIANDQIKKVIEMQKEKQNKIK